MFGKVGKKRNEEGEIEDRKEVEWRGICFGRRWGMKRGRSKERENRGNRGAHDFVPSRSHSKKESPPQAIVPHILTLCD